MKYYEKVNRTARKIMIMLLIFSVISSMGIAISAASFENEPYTENTENILPINEGTNATDSEIQTVNFSPFNIGTDFHISNGNVTISDSGTYIITGTGTNSIIVTDGSPTIILSGLNITSGGCAFSVTGNSDVTLIIEGNCSLTSSAGYAGIYVEVGSSLTISGESSGTLTVKGGDGSTKTPHHAGGAGIGGHGVSGKHSFGTIIIRGGEIIADGGKTSANVNYAAGAGIGTGGMTATEAIPAYGKIIIHDGNIVAAGGGCAHTSDTGGGAGIGSGGVTGEFASYGAEVDIEIHGGNIKAYGKFDGAGIGAGANGHSYGKIIIDGGTIYAAGGDEGDGSSWGGAGIGGGDMGDVSYIRIAGTAQVTAYGGGAAAGIGSGHGGAVWNNVNDDAGEIIIEGDAQVTAWGGSRPSASPPRGGAGIGAGRNYYGSSYPQFSNGGYITISGNASVTAYGGSNAQAVGVGSGYVYHDDYPHTTLTIDDTVTIKLFNSDSNRPAYPPIVYGSGSSYIVAFTLSQSENPTEFPIPDSKTPTTTNDDLLWYYSGSSGDYTLYLYDTDQSYNSELSTFGNWAVMYQLTPVYYTVTFESNGGSQVEPITDIPSGSTIREPDAPIRTGHTFEGWYIDEEYTKLWDFDNDTVTENITLYAKWIPNPTTTTNPPTTTTTTTVSTTTTTSSTSEPSATTNTSSEVTSTSTTTAVTTTTAATTSVSSATNTTTSGTPTTTTTTETTPDTTAPETTQTEQPTTESTTESPIENGTTETPPTTPPPPSVIIPIEEIPEDRIVKPELIPEEYVVVQYDESMYVIYDEEGVPLGYIVVPEGMTIDEMTLEDMIPLGAPPSGRGEEETALPVTGGMMVIPVMIVGMSIAAIGLVMYGTRKKHV